MSQTPAQHFIDCVRDMLDEYEGNRVALVALLIEEAKGWQQELESPRAPALGEHP